jgi:hypothetical protein
MEAQGVSRRLTAGLGQLQYNKLNRFPNTSPRRDTQRPNLIASVPSSAD